MDIQLQFYLIEPMLNAVILPRMAVRSNSGFFLQMLNFFLNKCVILATSTRDLSRLLKSYVLFPSYGDFYENDPALLILELGIIVPFPHSGWQSHQLFCSRTHSQLRIILNGEKLFALSCVMRI